MAASQVDNKKQGTLPPIDWTKGVMEKKGSRPYGPSGPSGNFVDYTLGHDVTGQPITIKLFSPAAPWKPEWQYNCHGLTFAGGGGMIEDNANQDVRKILEKYYISVPVDQLKPGDILVWRAKAPSKVAGQNIHSATIVTLILEADRLGTSIITPVTIVRTKNGLEPVRDMDFSDVDAMYQRPDGDGPCDVLGYTRNSL